LLTVRPLLIFAPLLGFTVVYYLISLCVNFGTRSFDLDRHRDLVRSWRPSHYPGLDVFLPICGEPLEILRNTWTHVRAIAARYPGTVTPYVLDDGANPEAAALAEIFGFRYIVRPNRG
jgi:cellulose synthase (UDP-forming)